MKFFVWIIAFLVLLIIAYNIWAESGKEYGSYTHSGLFAGEIINLGKESGKGSIVGIQPYLIPFDYCDEQHFKQALRPYFEKARASGFLQPNSIMMLPENTGTWLVTAKEKSTVYQVDSLQQAISIIANSNIITFIGNLLFSRAEDKIKQTLFLMKANSMTKIYEAVFSSLAKEYQVTIIAGSIVLPNPSVNNKGRLKIKKGALYNASFVFGPDGKIIAQPIKKQYLMNEERQYITSSANKNSSLIKTPAGNLSVLLSTDSWNQRTFNRSKVKPDIIAVAASDEPATSWASSWKGFKGLENEAGIDTTDYGRLTVGEAWIKYGSGRKAFSLGVGNTMYVFFSGKLWENQFQGRVITKQIDSVKVFPPATVKGRIVNLWLN